MKKPRFLIFVVILPAILVVGGFSTDAFCQSGTLDGHEYVDLGLPSGTKWATCNVGASNPEDYGNYYAWGETTTKESYNWDNYLHPIKYGNDGLITLEACDDVVVANWGSGWRMPTKEEMDELYNSCTNEWTIRNGINGRLFTGPNGNSIFLPAAGEREAVALGKVGSRGVYWTSSLGVGNQNGAWYLCISMNDCYMSHYSYRANGQSVRPVCVPTQN